MPTIDAHQHFWKYTPESHSWIDEPMKVIRKDFLPGDLKLILEAAKIDGSIAIQAEQSEAETNFLITLAAENNFIKGVVGWVDLTAKDIHQRLAYYHQFEIVKGFRHVLQAETPDFMLHPSFLNGIKSLKSFNYAYDILVFPEHLTAVNQLVKQNPEQLFIIDHLAKPYMKNGLIKEWQTDITAIADFENVYCKISGLVTEADYYNWKQADFVPYLDVAINAFGSDRIMFGSDWPVCIVAASYDKVVAIVKDYIKSFSVVEQEKIFGLNAMQFYKIK